MQLTKTQKDVLVRKALELIDAKREAKRAEFKKTYKPSKELAELLKKVKPVFEAREALLRACKDAGMELGNYNIRTPNVPYRDKFYVSMSHESGHLDFDKDIADELKKLEMTEQFVDDLPTEQAVSDDLELANLGKSFDVDAFLAKYQTL